MDSVPLTSASAAAPGTPSSHAQASPLLATLAPLALVLQGLFAVVMLLLSPAPFSSFPAQYVIMPLSLWLVAFWLLVWRPELALLLVLSPQVLHTRLTGEKIRVRYLFGFKVAVAVLLLLALGLRRLLGDRHLVRVRTPFDVPMLVFGLWGVAMMLYGFMRGNPLVDVLTAANEILQIPVIYLLLTIVMGDWRRISEFGVVFAALNTPIALYSIFTYGRGGGIYSSFLLVPLLAFLIASPLDLKHRPIVVAYAVLGALDVLLCQHRALWFATGIGVLFVVRRFAKEARSIATIALVFGVAVAIVALAQPGGQSLGFAAERFSHSTGRRGLELQLGLGMWWQETPAIGSWGGGTGVPVPWPNNAGTYPIGPWFHNFYLVVLFNAGIPGLLLHLWTVWRVMSGKLTDTTSGVSLPKETILGIALQGLYLGWLAVAAFSAPAEGHWELGALPALIGVLSVMARQQVQTEKLAEARAKPAG